jgi:CheY-like chemotaxis protein
MPTKKIVLSNDPALVTILENSFFQREGFEMVEVKDGQTGYEAVEAEAPTMAVFDIARLGTQALTCCRSIKKDPLLSQTPVLLVLPSRTEEDLADQCWDAGCDAVVHRPLVAERFLDAACGLLGISRRLARRFPVSFQLQFVDEKEDKHVGSCVNLNLGGMFLATETLFPVDTTLMVEFNLPGTSVTTSRPVRVAWVNHPEWRKKTVMPCGMGLQFVEMTTEWKNFLESFISRLSIEKQ